MFAAAQVERVIRHLVRFGSSRADAEDLAQEALVIAWRKQAELDRDRSLDGWLYGIARNVYRNHVRSQRRRELAVNDDEPTADARDLTDVVAFRNALGALPENQQDIIILHELEEYTLKETAELLAIPFDTAKDRLRRARDVLREQMHVDVAAAAGSERRATTQLARAAAPAVLVGVLGVIAGSSTAAAATGASATAAAAGSATSTGATGAGATATTGKLLLVGVLAGGIALGVVGDRLVRRDAPAPVADRAPAPAHVVQAEVADAGADDAPTEDAPAPSVAATDDAMTAPRPLPAVPATNPEAQLVERARVALRGGAPDDAIRTLMAHERRFSDGQLAEERDILLVEAYLAAGKHELAHKRLDRYTATYPAGLHKQRAADAARELERRDP